MLFQYDYDKRIYEKNKNKIQYQKSPSAKKLISRNNDTVPSVPAVRVNNDEMVEEATSSAHVQLSQ